jgi:hypothetical protein
MKKLSIVSFKEEARENRRNAKEPTIWFNCYGVAGLNSSLVNRLQLKKGDMVSFGKDKDGNNFIFKQNNGREENSVEIHKNKHGQFYFCSRQLVETIAGIKYKSKSPTTKFRVPGETIGDEKVTAFLMEKIIKEKKEKIKVLK